MKKGELEKIWERYIDKPVYRVVPLRDYNEILKKGIDPKKNPYKKIKPKIRGLLRIIKKLEKKGFVMLFNWGSIEVTGSYAIEVTLIDLSLGCIDFTPNKKDIRYYMNLKGGAVSSNVRKITKRLIEERLELSRKEWRLIKSLNTWARKKECKNKAFYVLGSSKIFETALFQIFSKRKSTKRYKLHKPSYITSPFGSFEHFKKTIEKYGLIKYINYLNSGKFYLRVKNKISASEINKLR